MHSRLAPLLALLALAVAPGPTPRAEVQIRLQMGFPLILPPLVVVEPGVRVVQDFDEEVFFIGGYYWVQRNDAWYRARDHRGTWRYVQPGGLPPALVHREPGRYRRWQHDERRSWPEPSRAAGDARHWDPRDHQAHGPGKAPASKDDRRGGEGQGRGNGKGSGHGDPGHRDDGDHGRDEGRR